MPKDKNQTKKPSRRRAAEAARSQPAALRFTRVNAALGVAGLLTLTLGYWLLAQGSITAAPLLLVLAYVVLLPLAIIL
ncbi:MAG: hypothetical protein WD101_02450 [Gemmatimonadota bacterium]